MTKREDFPAAKRLAAALLLALLAAPAAAQEPAAEEEPEPRWTGKAGLAFVSTSGNTDNENLGLDVSLERRPEPWGLELQALLERAEEDDVATAERYLLGLRGTRALGERWELFAGVVGEQDEFAGIDLRTVAEAGFVFHALRGETHALSFDVGAAWTDEDRLPPEPDTDYLGAVVGIDYEAKISDTAAFTERVVYHPNFDDSGDWRLDSTTALTASLTSRFALKLSYELRFRNRPVGGREDTDTSTRATLVVNF